MTYDEIVSLLNGHPVAQELLRARIPARLAYIALDGTPRAIPISYHWDGSHFYISSPPTWPKVKALEKNPKVAFTVDDASFYPPHNLIVRGEVTGTELVQGLPQVYIEASRRIVGEGRFDTWLKARMRDTTEMVVVQITPTFVKVVDYVNAYPGPS
jgi:Pyridoxamine 5'-phosphate oxidase